MTCSGSGTAIKIKTSRSSSDFCLKMKMSIVQNAFLINNQVVDQYAALDHHSYHCGCYYYWLK